MAKATANGKHLVKEWTTEVTTERPIPIYKRNEDGSIFYADPQNNDFTMVQTGCALELCTTREKWQLRSDNAVLHRIVWSKIEGQNYYGKDGRLDFSSGYRIRFHIKTGTLDPVQAFESWLTKHNYTIVK